MNKMYPNASSDIELKILEAIDDEKHDSQKYKKLLGSMITQDPDNEKNDIIGDIRYRHSTGEINDKTYLISLENNLDENNNKFSLYFDSLNNYINDKTEFNTATFAENDVKLMKNNDTKPEDIALSISHNIIKTRQEEDICFSTTQDKLMPTFKNAGNFLKSDKVQENYIRDAFLSNPDKARDIAGVPVSPAVKEDKEHPMMSKIWKSLTTSMESHNNLMESDIFIKFPTQTKEKQVAKAAGVANSSIVMFGGSDETSQTLNIAQKVNKDIKKSKKNETKLSF